MADTNLIDTALILKLANDAVLHALLPHGVFWGQAPQGATRFALVALSVHFDAPMLNDGDAYEELVYEVKAVVMGADNDIIDNAAKRIHELLHRQTLEVEGYDFMSMRRARRLRYTEPEGEPTTPWQHRGGLYEVLMSPI